MSGDCMNAIGSADPKMDARDRRRILKILESNWQAEMRGYHTYEVLAERESDPARRAAFHTLALCRSSTTPSSGPSAFARWEARTRCISGPKTGEADTLANRAGGVRLALRRLELDESRDIAKYAKQIKELGDEPSIRILEQALEDEREHYQTLSGLIRNRRPIRHPSPEQAKHALDELLAARQEDHPKAAGWIGDAIYGINDGLGAIFGIVSGVSGATLGNSKFVIIAGMVGMIASALSMGSGAFLAAKSEREIYEAEFSREREAVEHNEAEAREVLSLSYQIRGLPPEEADRFVEHLAKDKDPVRPHAGARTAEHDRRRAQEAADFGDFRRPFDGHRRHDPRDSIFLSERLSGGDRCRDRFPAGPLRRGRRQVADHDPFVVGQRTRNDFRRRRRGRRHLLHRNRNWKNLRRWYINYLKNRSGRKPHGPIQSIFR